MPATTLIGFVAFIAIALIISLAIGYAFMMQYQPNIPMESPVEARGTLYVSCNYNTITTDTWSLDSISGLNMDVEVYAKNHVDEKVTVTEIFPLLEQMQGTRVWLNMQIPPHEDNMMNATTTWAQNLVLTRMVYPGDELEIVNNILKLVTPGTLVLFFPPWDSPPPATYKPFFNAPAYYQPNITGDLVSAEISDPGHASMYTTFDAGQPEFLILGYFDPEEWHYINYDVPFFVDIRTLGNTLGFYMLPSGEIYLPYYGRVYAVQNPDQPHYFVIHKYEDVVDYYLDDNPTPAFYAEGYTDGKGQLAFGIARTTESEKIFKIVIILWNWYWRKFNLPGMWKNHETEYFYVRGTIYGASKIALWGPYSTYGSFYDPETWRKPVYDPSICKCGDWNWPPYVWIMQYDPPGPSPVDDNGVYHGRDIVDLIFGWDDTLGCCIEEKFRITIFEDGWARIEHLRSAGPPSDEVFVAPANNYVPGPDNDGNGFPDNWVHLWTLRGSSTVAQGAVWMNLSQIIKFEVYRVSSRMGLGIYRSPYITIHNLYPGDQIILVANGKRVVLTANATTEKINLLKYYTAEDLVKAILSGGIYLTIVPSPEHITTLIPVLAKIRVKGEHYDYWETIKLNVYLTCKPTFTVDSQTGRSYNTYIENRGDAYYVTTDELTLGNYYAVYITVYNGNVTVTLNDGQTISINVDEASAPLRLVIINEEYIGVIQGGLISKISDWSKVTISGVKYEVTLSVAK